MSKSYSQLFYLKLGNDKHSDNRNYVSTHVENTDNCGWNSDNRIELNVEETENVAASDDEVEIKSVFVHFEHVFKLNIFIQMKIYKLFPHITIVERSVIKVIL